MMRKSVSQLERDLNDLSTEIANAQPLPNLQALERVMTEASARVTLTPSPDGQDNLREAVRALDVGRAAYATRAQMNNTHDQLTKQLSEAKHAARMEFVEQANDRLAQAVSEYKHASLQAAKSFRNLLNVQRQSAMVPGAQSGLQNMRLHLFNLPSLIPQSWSGTLGEVMITGKAPYENSIYANAPEQSKEAA